VFVALVEVTVASVDVDFALVDATNALAVAVAFSAAEY
jgi:hypothetical protein